MGAISLLVKPLLLPGSDTWMYLGHGIATQWKLQTLSQHQRSQKLQAYEPRVQICQGQIGKDPERVWDGMSGPQEGVSIPVRRGEYRFTRSC